MVEQIYCPRTQVAMIFDLCNCWKACFSWGDGANVSARPSKVFSQGVFNSSLLVDVIQAAFDIDSER